MCKAGALRGAGSVPGLTAASVLFLSLKKIFQIFTIKRIPAQKAAAAFIFQESYCTIT